MIIGLIILVIWCFVCACLFAFDDAAQENAKRQKDLLDQAILRSKNSVEEFYRKHPTYKHEHGLK